VLVLLAGVGLLALRHGYGIARWRLYIWLPAYLSTCDPDPEIPDAEKHIIFLLCDHYEPGSGAKGAQKNEKWLAAFRPVADRHQDSYGNRFRYTWFYPYDHKNEAVLAALCRMAREGYGEVELHWHHPPATDQTFPAMLQEAIAWFQRHGALVSSGPDRATHFAFIHGNWRLDNSSPDGKCGVNRELDILFQHGCYADFTFSTIGTPSQPAKVNSIYYATDTPEPKSYDTGIDAQVGKPVDDRLMIFEGPISYSLLHGVEYAAVEGYDPDLWANEKRVERWIDCDIHIHGRPEWVFVKVYTHGASGAFVPEQLDRLLTDVENVCRRRGLKLHYMTAREAYNVVKAAEDGQTGNPEDCRDWRIPRPLNVGNPESRNRR